MKKNDYEELDDEIIDDEILDDEEIDDEFADDFEEIDDEPAPKAKKPAKAVKKAPAKKKMKKGVKVAIISSSAAAAVIAIALVAIFLVLPLFGINLIGNKKAGSLELYYNPEATYGLFFYGDNHKALNTGTTDADIDVVRAAADMSTSYFDPSKPTIIWTHGWEMTGSYGDAYLCAGADTRKVMSSYDVSYVNELKKKGYNVATFQYQGYINNANNDAANLNAIYKNTVVKVKGEKHSMSYMFASELATILGEKYEKDVTLVGHSCGAFVSTATAFMLQTFYQDGAIKNKHLVPARLILEDPYVDGTENEAFKEGQLMDGTKEEISSRTKCQVVLNMLESLGKNSNVAIDAYLGMGGASTSFVQNSKFKKDVHPEDFANALPYMTVVDMTGMKQWQGVVGNIHVLTRDWVWSSMLGNKLKDDKGNLAPSAACTNEEIISMRGNLYQQTAKGFVWGNSSLTEKLTKVTTTDGFNYAKVSS